MTNPSILLDTHTWIWLMSGEGNISQKAIIQVEKARENNSLYLSDISLWETSMLIEKQRITLNQPILSWIKNAIKVSNIHLVHLTPEIVVESNALGQNFHGDPADRIIVATARIMNLILFTRDQKILKYGKSKHLLTFCI